MFNLKDNGIDFYVNSRKELQKVLDCVKRLHDNVMICVDNDEDEILKIYFDEIYKNYNLDVLDSVNYLTVNDFIVETIEEIESLIVEAYGLD
jgi:hypothetical protein